MWKIGKHMASPKFMQIKLAAALLNAFPSTPKPAFAREPRTQLESDALSLLLEKTWIEAVNFTLTDDGLDCSLSAWTRTLPPPVVAYFLPSHLMLASICLVWNAKVDYPDEVMEALLLPTVDIDNNDELERELCVSAAVVSHPNRGIGIYRELTASQRICVADFLELYYRRNEWVSTSSANAFYLENIEHWRTSSYPGVDN